NATGSATFTAMESFGWWTMRLGSSRSQSIGRLARAATLLNRSIAMCSHLRPASYRAVREVVKNFLFGDTKPAAPLPRSVRRTSRSFPLVPGEPIPAAVGKDVPPIPPVVDRQVSDEPLAHHSGKLCACAGHGSVLKLGDRAPSETTARPYGSSLPLAQDLEYPPHRHLKSPLQVQVADPLILH